MFSIRTRPSAHRNTAKLSALRPKVAPVPKARNHHAGEGRTDETRQIERDGAQGHCGGQVFAADQAGHEGHPYGLMKPR